MIITRLNSLKLSISSSAFNAIFEENEYRKNGWKKSEKKLKKLNEKWNKLVKKCSSNRNKMFCYDPCIY